MKIPCIMLGKPTPSRTVVAVTINDTVARRQDLVLHYRQKAQRKWMDAVGSFTAHNNRR